MRPNRQRGRRMSDAERAKLPDNEVTSNIRSLRRRDPGGSKNRAKVFGNKVAAKVSGLTSQQIAEIDQAVDEIVLDNNEGIKTRQNPYMLEAEYRLDVKQRPVHALPPSISSTI